MGIKEVVEQNIAFNENTYRDSKSVKYRQIIHDYKDECELIEAYRGRELLELLQNADDELNEKLPKEVKISFINNELTIFNYGNPFTDDGISALMFTHTSDKHERKKRVIGNKGTGFRSVLGWADSIQIDSDNLHVVFSESIAKHHLEAIIGEEDIKRFKLKPAVMKFPEWNNEYDDSGYTTRISIRIKDNKSVATDILEQLNSINEELLLFLNNTMVLIVETCDTCVRFERVFETENCVRIIQTVDNEIRNESVWDLSRSEGYIENQWYSIVVAGNRSGEDPSNKVLYSYFPTQVEFPFPVLVHANFVLSPDRNHLISKTSENNLNSQLLQRIANQLVSYSIAKYGDKVSYDCLRFLMPKEKFPKELVDFGFEEMLKDAIRGNAVFPNVNGSYISAKQRPQFFKTFKLCAYLSGRQFRSYMPPCYTQDGSSIDNKLTQFITSLVGPHKDLGSIVEDLNTWIEGITKKITVKNMEKLAFTISEYSHLVSLTIVDKEVYPDCIVDTNGQLVKAGETVFCGGEDISIKEVPSFAKIRLMHPMQEQAFRDIGWDMSKSGIWRLSVKSMNFREMMEMFNSHIRNNLQNEQVEKARENCRSVISWLWTNKDALKSENGRFLVYVISRNGNIVKASDAYYGEEYGNPLGDRLWGELAEEKLVEDIRDYTHPDRVTDVDDIVSFVESLGVKRFPRKERKWIDNISSVDDRWRIVAEANYPFIIQDKKKRITKKSPEELLSFITKLSCYSTHIDSFEYILNHADTLDILDWISEDEALFKLLKNRHEERIKADVVGYLWGQKFNTWYMEISTPYALVVSTFEKSKWIHIGNDSYSINDCLIGEEIGDILAPNLVQLNIRDLLKGRTTTKKERALEKTYKSLLIGINVKEHFSELPIDKIYEVLLSLPNIENSEKLAYQFYRGIVENSSTYDKSDVLRSEQYKKFVRNGKILCNHGYCDVTQSYYVSGRDLCEKITDKFNIAKLPRRRGEAEKIELLFGIKRLELEGSIKGEPMIHPLNTVFQKDFSAYRPFAFCLRLDAKKDFEAEARKFARLEIILCSEIRADYSGEEVNLNEYEYIMEKPSKYYLKLPDAMDMRSLHDFEVASCVGNIIAAYTDIPMLSSICRELYSNVSNRRAIILDETGDESSITRSKSALHVFEDMRQEFEDVLSLLSGREISSYAHLIDLIDFDEFKSIDNLRILHQILSETDIEPKQFNECASPQMSIDFTDYYREKITDIKSQLREKYRTCRFNDLLAAPINEKMNLVSSFLEYESDNVKIENSIKFSPQEQLEKQLSIDPTCQELDLDELYKTNLKAWKQQTDFDETHDEFLNNPPYKSLLYYGCYDELNKLYNEYHKKQIRMKNSDLPEETTIPPVTKPNVKPAAKRTTKKVQKASKTMKTGFSTTTEKKRVENGKKGEEVVYTSLLQNPQYHNVRWVSENAIEVNPEGRAGCGYDIEFCDEEGRRWFVEVKSSESSISNEIRFDITENELEFARKHDGRFLIYYVSCVNDEKNRRIDILPRIIGVDGEIDQEKYSVIIKREYTLTAEIE